MSSDLQVILMGGAGGAAVFAEALNYTPLIPFL